MRGAIGQVWVETVIYTLMAFIMIGVVLAVAKPKIEELQDKAVIKQSVEIMENVELIIKEIEYYKEGNQRSIKIDLKKGTLSLDGVNDLMAFEFESRFQYSEPGSVYSEGNMDVQTTKKGGLNIVSLSRNYSLSYNITYQQKDELKTLNKASIPYNVVISNKGVNTDGRTEINFEIQ